MAGTLSHWQEFNWINVSFAQTVPIRVVGGKLYQVNVTGRFCFDQDGIVGGLDPNQIAFPWD